MRINHLGMLLGLTTAALIATPFSAQSATVTRQIASGSTTFNFDLESLKSLGLSFNSAKGAVISNSGFDFDITDSGLVFSYDDADLTKPVAPIKGTLEYTGSLLFDVDASKLSLLSPFELGNFVLETDYQENASFFLKDTISTGYRVFDLGNATFDGSKLNFGVAKISQQFSNDLAYAQIPDTSIPETPKPPVTVPEPGSLLAILITGVALRTLKRSKVVRF